MKIGLELEYFVTKDNNVVPAYLATNNLDGNPVVGEIRTGIHNSLLDAVFELKKLLFLESQRLAAKGFKLELYPEINVSNDFKRQLREDKNYVNKKQIDLLKEFSIYPNGKLGQGLKTTQFKASLQVNLSDNKQFSYPVYTKVSVDDKYKYDQTSQHVNYGAIFNYPEFLWQFDKIFAAEIKAAKRQPGVYAIKSGELGDRVEYRSLPNNVDLDKLLSLNM